MEWYIQCICSLTTAQFKWNIDIKQVLLLSKIYYPIRSHQNTYKYSLSAFDYSNYIDNYESRTKAYTFFLKLPFSFKIKVEIEKWNIKTDINLCYKKKIWLSIVTVSAQHVAYAMHIQMVNPALYPKHIQFGEERIQCMWVAYSCSTIF